MCMRDKRECRLSVVLLLFSPFISRFIGRWSVYFSSAGQVSVEFRDLLREPSVTFRSLGSVKKCRVERTGRVFFLV